jgi:hypothetical protein
VFLPTPHEITRNVYRRDFHAAAARGRTTGEKLWGYFRAVQHLFSVRRGGVTVLWK